MKPEQISAIALEVAKDMSVAPSDYLHHDALPELCTRFLAAFTAKAEPFSTLCVWRHGNIEMITDSPPEDTDYKTVDVFLHPADQLRTITLLAGTRRMYE